MKNHTILIPLFLFFTLSLAQADPLADLKSQDYQVRVHAVNELASQEPVQAVPMLVEVINHPDVIEVKRAAYLALAKMNTREAWEFIYAVVNQKHEQEKERSIAAEMIVEYANGRFTEQMAGMLPTEKNIKVRYLILKDIEQHGGPKSILALKTFLKANTVPIRALRPITILSKLSPREATSLAIEQLQTVQDEILQKQYILLLVNSHDKRAIKPITTLLVSTTDDEIYDACLSALIKLKAQKSLKDIAAQALSKENDRRAVSAITAMQHIGGNKAYTLLLDAYTQQDNAFNEQTREHTPSKQTEKVYQVYYAKRILMLDALTAINLDRSIPLLKKASEPIASPYPAGEQALRVAAIQALVGSNNKTIATYLMQQKYLDDPDMQIRLVTIRGLDTLLGQNFVPTLIVLAKDKHPYIRKIAIDHLAKYPTKESLGTLIDVLDDPISEVVVASLNALAKQNNPDATGAIKMMRQSDNEKVRKTAAEILKSLGDGGDTHFKRHIFP